MFRFSAFVAAAVIVAASAVAGADRVSAPARAGTSAAAARGTSILGHAWSADNTPIKQAKLRLRNVTSGKVEATTTADESGRFTFSNIEGGSYVVEIVNDAGKVLAVGHTFTIGAGETVGTFVRLGTKVPWFNGFFTNTAAAAASSAASQGVTALAPVARPASSRR